MDDGMLVDVIHDSHDAILEFLFGCDADRPQDGAGKFREEAVDQVQPGAVLGSESEFEAAPGCWASEPFVSLCGMTVEDRLDRRADWVDGIKELQEFNEFAAAMPVPDQSVNLAGQQVEFRRRGPIVMPLPSPLYL
jgi:hypothetical protein